MGEIGPAKRFVPDASGTFRALYTVSIGNLIYVIHAFQKKSKAGIATPKSEMDLIRQRLTQLRGEVRNAEEKDPLNKSLARATYSRTSASPMLVSCRGQDLTAADKPLMA